jgi:hypothetical protein
MIPFDKSSSADPRSLRLLASLELSRENLELSREKLGRPKELTTSFRSITSQPPASFTGRTVSIASGRGFRHFQKETNKRRKLQVPAPEPDSAA